jgi:uncharacterized lipoprotein NlpE involved in copper resistance
MKKPVVLALFATLALAGCKSKEERAVDLFEEYAKVLDDNQADCEKAGKAAVDFAKAHESDFKDLSASKLEGDDKKKFEEKYKDRMTKAMDKTFAVAAKCATNDSFSKAMQDAGKIMGPGK